MTGQIAVLLPCYNEGGTIGGVVRAFRAALPRASIYVYDNNSTDGTKDEARAAGAIVRHEPLQGKGSVVARMFADVEADIYLMCDGDGTYDAAAASALIARLVGDELDMVVGTRVGSGNSLYRTGHRFGNRALTGLIGFLFASRFRDVLSGYRAMSRRFVKSFPALASGFEVEIMLAIHALELRVPTAEVDCEYCSRPTGTASKLHTIRDGLRIGAMLLYLFKEVRPFLFFGALAALLSAVSLAIGVPVILEYMQTGLVPRFPSAILATGVMLLAGISLTSGVILDSVVRGRLEAKRGLYQSIPALGALRAPHGR